MSGDCWNVRPLRWWSNSSLAAASAIVESTWARWCERWDAAATGVIALNASDADCGSWMAPNSAIASLSGTGAWLCVPSSSAEWFGGLLFGPGDARRPTDGSPVTSIGDEVANQASDDLRSSLRSLLVSADEPSCVVGPLAPPPTDRQHWSGALVLSLACGLKTPHLSLHLSAASASRLIARTAPQRDVALPIGRPLEPVLEAAGRCTVRCTAELKPLTLDFASLQSLRCGDVLAFPHALDEPLRVHVLIEDLRRSSHEVSSGLLGARGGRRAVEVIRRTVANG